MAIKVKSAAEAAEKWATQTPGRAQYYQSGAVAAGSDWLNNTLAAKSNFQTAVTAGNIGTLFAGGVKRAGADKFVRKVNDVGATRFASGITAAKTDYQSGVDPMLATIAGVTLPARAPRGAASNLQRVAAIATALNAKRLSLRAAGA